MLFFSILSWIAIGVGIADLLFVLWGAIEGDGQASFVLFLIGLVIEYYIFVVYLVTHLILLIVDLVNGVTHPVSWQDIVAGIVIILMITGNSPTISVSSR